MLNPDTRIPASGEALLTDLYQLTMAQGYFELGMHGTAVFELYVRRLPAARKFLIAAGLEQTLEYLEQLRFGPDELEFLVRLRRFSTRFLDYLSGVRFTGTVHALPEGTAVFETEPLLRVAAPILEGQLVESRIVNLMHFQTLIASKAARCVLAAGGRQLVDFGMRRAHGAEAAILASRAAYLAGFDATATVEAGRRFGIPLAGTMAHSFIEAHDSEIEALRNFAMSQAGRTTLLIDTYDTGRAAERVVELSREFGRSGRADRIAAVRIDSGDLAIEARRVRAILDAGGRPDIEIVLSGGLDEYAVRELVGAGIPVNAFGIGTHLDVSGDAPSLDIAYKLQEYAGRARRKRSPGKATWPGRKQIQRVRAPDGGFLEDRVVLEDETSIGTGLLEEVMRDGRRVNASPALADQRRYCRAQLDSLPDAIRSLDCGGSAYPVQVSDNVRALAARIDASLGFTPPGP